MGNSRYPLIRAMNRNAFRSGEWARIIGVEVVPSQSLNDYGSRCCFLVEFLDGKTDYWPVEDAAQQYEFMPSLKG